MMVPDIAPIEKQGNDRAIPAQRIRACLTAESKFKPALFRRQGSITIPKIKYIDPATTHGRTGHERAPVHLLNQLRPESGFDCFQRIVDKLSAHCFRFVIFLCCNILTQMGEKFPSQCNI